MTQGNRFGLRGSSGGNAFGSISLLDRASRFFRLVGLESTLLKSRVGRRLLLLFISCAVVPLAITSFLSFSNVTDQLYEQSEMRLRHESKAVGLAILRELLVVASEFEHVELCSRIAMEIGK